MSETATLELPVFKPSRTLKAVVPVPPTLRELDHGQQVPTNHEGDSFGVLRVLTENDGDKRFAWNPRSLTEINEARDFFDRCVAEGLVPYKVGTGGNASAEVMDEFDPYAGEVIFLPVAVVAGG